MMPLRRTGDTSDTVSVELWAIRETVETAA
jgi:hypothetical protein